MEGIFTTDEINRVIKTVGSCLFLPAVVTHELLHFIPAKALRASPSLHICDTLGTETLPHVISHPKTRISVIIICFFPTFVGLMCLPLINLVASMHYVISAYVLFSYAMITTPSIQDLGNVYKILKHN